MFKNRAQGVSRPALTAFAACLVANLALAAAPPPTPPGPPPGPPPAPAQPPAVIPAFTTLPDPAGQIATLNVNGATTVATQPFFTPLGTNGRACITCHQAQDAWTISVPDIQRRFQASNGTDPLFRPVDGAVCPTADLSTAAAVQKAYGLLLSQGLLRIGLAIPADAQFTVAIASDPYGCNSNPATGLTGPSSGTLSVYRRPLPAANLAFLTGIMWDGREPSLTQQAIDATLIHAQATAAPTTAQLAAITGFETGLFTAQETDNQAGDLTQSGASGGAAALAQQRFAFFVGINDSAGQNPTGAAFDPAVFDLYKTWNLLPEATDAAQQSIARGETLFNNRSFVIKGVGGLNDVAGVAAIPGTCSTCHDTPDVGNHSLNRFLDIGVADAGNNAPKGLNVSALPVFTLTCVQGPLAGQSFTVSDPGRAMTTGQCADIAHVKLPVLRGLAARAPYFHNGSAGNLGQLVDFYDRRFTIGLTAQEKQDLVNFLQSL